MFYSRFLLAAATVAVVAAQEGKPVDDMRSVNRTEPAVNAFGTTTQTINWTSMPETLCVVPAYTNKAGMGSEKKALTVQQALDLCPRAQRVAVNNS
ncbi:hypothetical protein RSOLAG1IB_03103 [Rhizoctonia solani AG-1 IB]|uniref:Uncharacterized protein n=2 Tax=Rhizoctonia solani TaxID=456999 RepID=M5BM01_THACB|nr:unnamed protein product [Rhizoctonia solani]CCO27914.1 hypothetical protein BN14_01903 [Rhizoctonia solani AG-1 IB]CEL58357.1 hypothetical protein RSOLAG1IB_03103 [Rhizoctonia solani AG-1 IB]